MKKLMMAVAVALGVLSAGAENFVEEEPHVVDLVTKGLSGDAARDEFVKACEAAMNGSKDKAQIILVEGDLNISYGDKAHTALNKLFNQNRKIALLCNSPDFASMGKTFWELTEDDFRLTHEVVIDGGSKGRCLTIDSKKSLSTSSVAGNNVGLIYGVRFKNGVSQSDGGAVDARGSVRFVNCTFQDCKSTGGANNGGGAIYFPPEAKYLAYAFCPRRFSDRAGMESEMSMASCSLCTFRNCTAKNNGGAIYTVGSKYGVIKDCVFDQCEADGSGGALYEVEKVERSMFRKCKAKKQGGAIRYVDSVQTSLFADTSAQEFGALGDLEESVIQCTFVNCAATKSEHEFVMPQETTVGYSIIAGTDAAYKTYVFGGMQNYSWTTGDAEQNFLNYNGGDFHLKPVEPVDEDKIPALIAGFGATYDLDRQSYLMITNVMARSRVAGCYRYNTKEEIEEQKKNLDIAILNPLIVTTTMDVVDPIDGRISFREACSNLMAHVEPPRGMADQWPRITFELPSSSRYIDIQGETPFEIADSKRTNPERLGRDHTSKFTPIVIDGGVKGLTIRGGDGNSSVVLKLSSAARIINVNFDNAPVEMEASRAREGNYEAKFCVSNCAFTGGAAILPLVRTDAAGHAFEFTQCSFVNAVAGGATSAVRFDQGAKFSASFTCCTFAGFDNGDGTVIMPAADGDLSFGSCTFARNGAADNAAFADIWIGDGVKGGSVHLGDCLFADGRDRALRCPATFTVYGKIATDDGTTPAGALMENLAGSAANALDSTTPVRMMVAGIGHTAFQPKHGGPARRGCRTIFFDDKTIYEQPKTDIFGFPQEGERTSLGSRFVDDVETRSITVDLKEDVEDPYDDRISFREAIAYGLSDYRAFGKGGYLTPLFATNLVEDGVVEIGLESAIALTDCKAFENGYTVWIKPGTDQRLELHTSDMGGGLFRQAANTRVRFDDVLFSDCCNYDGSGGVLDSAGWTRFNRCRFQNCFASEVKIIPAARALAAAYELLFDTLKLADGRGREVVLKSIPPGYRARFADAEETLVTALATCTNTIGILRQSGLTISNRLVKASAYLDDFMEATRNVAETFNIFYLYAPTIVMRLNAEGICVNADRFAASLAEAEAAMKTFEGLREKLKTEVFAVAGSGGALNLRETAACIVYDATADGCVTLGPGGFLANVGDFKGVNLTLTGNSAIDGGCIANLGGTNQLVSVAIAENFSETNGAVSVTGGALGLLNSIVVANRGGSVACMAPGTVKTVRSLVDSAETPVALADVFSTSAPAEHQVSNSVNQLYYPLRSDGRASHTGTFVFFNADTEKSQADGIESTWIKGICHTTDPDGFTPNPEWLFGSGRVHWNAGLYYDLLGKVIQVWEDPRTFTGAIPASMGPVPDVQPGLKGSVVTTVEDVVSDTDNVTSLREAAAYAMASNTTVVFDANLVAGGAVFELSNQIVVPPGKTLRISANPSEVTLKPSRTYGNRFFRVERGGRLELRGIVMDGGYAKGKYEVGTGPADDDDGGAICSEGSLDLVNCTIRNCRANGFGGAVWSGGGMTARDCTFAGNFAQRGGGLCSDNEPLRLSGVILTGNTAQDYGGGLYLVAGTNDAVATGASITGNAANGETVQGGPNFGGGVYVIPNGAVPPGEVTIVGTISDNEGGDEYRLDKRGAETSEKGGVPFQPIPRLMSARLAGALLADEERNVLSAEYEYDDSSPVCDVVRDGTTNQFALVEDALAFAQPRETVTLRAETRCDSLRIRDFITLDLNGFALLDYDMATRRLPAIEENTGVLVAYGLLEVDALMSDAFKGTMRFGRDVVWGSSETGYIMFVKGTDVTVGADGEIPAGSSARKDVYLVTTTFSDTYGLNEEWSVAVYGSAELGGSNYRDCAVEVFEDATIVTPLVLDGATLAVSGTVSFAEGAYIDLRSLTSGGVFTRAPIDYRNFRITDPEVAAGADVTCTQLDGGVLWYHLSDDPEVLSRVAEVDGIRYTLKEAFAVANTNESAAVTLLRDDGEDARTIPVGRDIAFDMNGKRIGAKDGSGVTFAVSNGCLAVTGGGSAESRDVRFELLHGDALDGGLHLAGGVFGMAGQPVVTVANGCTNAVVALTEGAQLLPSDACTSTMFVKLDGFADCLFDAAKVGGEGVAHAIVHHSARIAVTNGAELVSKDETILQTLAPGAASYDFTLEVSDANSLIRTVKGPACVASQLDEAGIGSATVANRFVCRSGDFECPTNGANAAVRFFGDVGYDVTGGRFGGAVKPVVSTGNLAVEDPVSQRDLYWQVIRPGQEGVYVAKVGNVKYESLEEAFSVVQPGDTVTMLADYSPILGIAVDVPVTLDLNGCTIALKSGQFGDVFTVGKEGELTILDSGGNGGVGVVTTPGSAVQYRDVTVHGTLKVYGGTFSSCTITGGGTLDFRGGRFPTSSIVGNGVSTELNIRNGVFGTADDAFRVVIDNFASITVSGGEFYNSTGAPFVHSRVDHPVQFLSGGTFYSPWDKKMDGSYCADGYAYEKLLEDKYHVVKGSTPSDSQLRIVGGRVYSGQYDITDAVTIRGGGTVELKAGGVVGGVKVTPVIGELPPSSDGEGGTVTPPFTVGSDGAALTFETIPGLCYGLLRGETPDRIDEVVDWGWAGSGTMTLKDFEAPKDGAFYRIVVKIEEF